MSPDTQGDPYCPLVNTFGLGVMAAPPIHHDSQHDQAQPKHNECDLPGGVVHPLLTF